MARVQTQYAPRGTGLQQFATPQVQTVQAQFQTPQEDDATRLARALGVLNPQQITNSLSQIEDSTRNDAVAYANSMTMDELGKKIRNGEVMPSQSPVFAATVQHIYGENYRSTLERDTLSKMASGELKFDTPQALDEYITKQRNEFLSGQSQYTTAGFDKGWNNFRTQAIAANTKINDHEATARGVQEASDNLGNVLLNVTSPTFGGGTSEQASALMQRYELLTATHLLRDDARKDALTNLLVRVAGSGNQALLNELLQKNLPNNGPSLGSFVGERHALTLQHTAEAAFDKAQRQRVDTEMAPFLRDAHSGNLDLKSFEQWRKDNEKYITSPTYESILMADQHAKEKQDKLNMQHELLMQAQRITLEAAQHASALVAARRGHEMPDIQVPTTEGTLKTIKGADLVSAEVERRIAADPNMPFDEQVRLYANNSAKNKQWEADLGSAYVNIGEVGVDAQGKPVGQLLPPTLEALNKFSIINQVSTGYARELAGSDSKYQLLTNLQALRESGVSDANLAASLVNQSERNIGKNIENINTRVNKAISDITNPGVFSGRFWGEVFSGEWGNGEKNLRVVQGAVRSLAKAYMSANVASNGEEAVKKAVEYYANPAVSTQINNTIYFNKDLPRVPDRQDQRYWFQRFINEEATKYLKDQGIKASASDIVLQPMLGGEPRYMLHLNGTPLGHEFLRRDVEAWITATDQKDILAKAAKAREPKKSPLPEMRDVSDPMLGIGPPIK